MCHRWRAVTAALLAGSGCCYENGCYGERQLREEHGTSPDTVATHQQAHSCACCHSSPLIPCRPIRPLALVLFHGASTGAVDTHQQACSKLCLLSFSFCPALQTAPAPASGSFPMAPPLTSRTCRQTSAPAATVSPAPLARAACSPLQTAPAPASGSFLMAPPLTSRTCKATSAPATTATPCALKRSTASTPPLTALMLRATTRPMLAALVRYEGSFPSQLNPSDHTGPCRWYQGKGVIRDIITSLSQAHSHVNTTSFPQPPKPCRAHRPLPLVPNSWCPSHK